jgi:hypothetical protein
VTPRDLRRLTVAGGVALTVLVAYWALWFLARDAIASDKTTAYRDFENAFPAADAWLGVCIVLALLGLHRQRPSALLWGLLAGGSGVYLFCMDVLYDLEHGIYAKGAGGLIELGVNLLTLGLSVWFLRFSWTHRAQILQA